VLLPSGLHALVSQTKGGRSSEQEITLFKSVSVVIEDIALATFACKQALAAGMGRERDMDPQRPLQPASSDR